jgi:predicted nucleic acid-binding protein
MTTAFVDTNVLVYLRDARDPAKQASAACWLAALWESRAGRLSTQVLHEYYVTVTAKLDPGLPAGEAREDVLALYAWRPVESTVGLIEAAWDVHDRWGFSFWDSMIVAAAGAAGSAILLTEDLSHDQQFGDLRVVNPFLVLPDAFAF